MDSNVNEKNIRFLDSLSPDDIAPPTVKKKKPAYYIFSALRIVLLIAFFGLFVYASFNLAKIYLSYNSEGDYYSDIGGIFDEGGIALPIMSSSAKLPVLNGFEEMLKSDGKLPVINSSEELEQLMKVRAKLANMKKTMPDLYGWIEVEGTNMNYPVVYSDDNDFYLTHAPDRTANVAGSIFVDMSCVKPIDKIKNLVIHGHNVRSFGMMFNGIVFFFEKPYFDSHKTITMYTEKGIFEYTIISVREVPAGSDYMRTEPRKGQTMTQFITNAIDRSKFKREGDIVYDDDSQLITLSTCTNYLSLDESRFTLVGLLTHKIVEQ